MAGIGKLYSGKPVPDSVPRVEGRRGILIFGGFSPWLSSILVVLVPLH